MNTDDQIEQAAEKYFEKVQAANNGRLDRDYVLMHKVMFKMYVTTDEAKEYWFAQFQQTNAQSIGEEDLQALAIKEYPNYTTDYDKSNVDKRKAFVKGCEAILQQQTNSASIWVKASERLPENKGSYITKRPTINEPPQWIIKEEVFNPKYDDIKERWISFKYQWLDENYLNK